ncbi:MAG: two-component system sensor histidine kinase CreC [Leptospirales bacterium]|nr:two-component system sensor histidine kinase CreC [Leptospirales bacterium]
MAILFRPIAAWAIPCERSYETYTAFSVRFFFVYALGLAYLANAILDELRPRYLEAVEETMNDAAHLLAARVEGDLQGGQLRTAPTAQSMQRANDRRFQAQIFRVLKTHTSMSLYITDQNGLLLFDANGASPGSDYSQWRDVARSLRGEYGARSTRAVSDDPASSTLVVGAPIYDRGRIVGVLSVTKPVDSITPFMELARSRLLSGVLLSGIGALLLAFLSFWSIGRPLRRFEEYVKALRRGERPPTPSFGRGEIGAMAHTFEELRRELEGRRYIEEYVQHLTHELKSPLSAIRASAEILKENPPPAERERFLAAIERESARAHSLAERLLELASLEGRVELNATGPVDLTLAVQAAMQECGVEAERRQINLQLEAPRLAFVNGDAFLLQRALANLLHNAIEFSPEGGAVLLRVLRGGATVRVEVRDQGPGIPDYAAPRVFERFFSLPRPDGRQKGAGIGLSLVREAARLHGGEALLYNHPAGGAVAELRLPAGG